MHPRRRSLAGCHDFEYFSAVCLFSTFLEIEKFTLLVQFRLRSAIFLHLLSDIRRHSIDGDNFHPRTRLNADKFPSFALIARFSRKLLQLSSSAVKFQCHGGAPRGVDSSHGTEVHRGRQANENLQQSLQDRAGERLPSARKCQSNFIFGSTFSTRRSWRVRRKSARMI